MKLAVDLRWQEIPHQGYTIYNHDSCRLIKQYCKWYIYPLFALYMLAKKLKTYLYHTLNDIGIMHTPEGCVMTFKDLFKKPQKSHKYENVIVGYFLYDKEEGE